MRLSKALEFLIGQQGIQKAEPQHHPLEEPVEVTEQSREIDVIIGGEVSKVKVQPLRPRRKGQR